MNDEVKGFPRESVLSAATGLTLIEFSKIHELAQWLMGHPIWTHEFASRELAAELRQRALAVAPDFAEFDCEGVGPENFRERMTAFFEAHKTPLLIDVPRGSAERLEDPISSLQRIAGEDKPIVAIELPE